MRKTIYTYVKGDYLSCGGRKCVVEGNVYKYLDRMKGNRTYTKNGKIFVDHYQLVGGLWKITIHSLVRIIPPIIFTMIGVLLVLFLNYSSVAYVLGNIVKTFRNAI